MTSTIKRFIGSTALAISLMAGAATFDATSAYAACHLEPIYESQGGRLVRVGWLRVC